jgi:hypothetical protein
MIAVILVPVVTVSFVAAVANDHLVPAASVIGISYPVISIMTPWFRTVYNNLITMVKIIIAVGARQISPAYPYIIIKIYILMSRNIIINANIGHIVIISMVITYRAPIRLSADIYAYAEVHLCTGYFK